MTTTPNEPMPGPEILPSGDPRPIEDPVLDPPREDPEPEVSPLP